MLYIADRVILSQVSVMMWIIKRPAPSPIARRINKLMARWINIAGYYFALGYICLLKSSSSKLPSSVSVVPANSSENCWKQQIIILSNNKSSELDKFSQLQIGIKQLLMVPPISGSIYTVFRSVITRTIEPSPALSTKCL